jgi:hypothetical protein
MVSPHPAQETASPTLAVAATTWPQLNPSSRRGLMMLDQSPAGVIPVPRALRRTPCRAGAGAAQLGQASGATVEVTGHSAPHREHLDVGTGFDGGRAGSGCRGRDLASMAPLGSGAALTGIANRPGNVPTGGAALSSVAVTTTSAGGWSVPRWRRLAAAFHAVQSRQRQPRLR